jgi:beta-lactamase class A
MYQRNGLPFIRKIKKNAMKFKIVSILSLLLFLTYDQSSFGQSDLLRSQIQEIVNSNKGTIGVAILSLEDGDSITINNHFQYPMQSIFKFHLALAVLHQVDKGKLSLQQAIFIKKKDLMTNTWSPLRDKYPNGEINIPLSDIIKYTISLSDNNGCDILFKLVGGPKKVDSYISSLGIKETSIVANESAMHKDWIAQFTNWAQPYAIVELLQLFYSKKILSEESTDFLWKTMIETSTGPKRIKGLLPTDAVVAHKTGSGDTDEKGLTTATNDIGIIELPNGKHIAIAVLVSMSPENDETRERIIALISKTVWDYFLKR